MEHNFNDGGRRAAGFSAPAKDCTVRAVAIATGRDYMAVYNDLKALAPRLDDEGVNVYGAFPAYMKSLGFAWVPIIPRPNIPDNTHLDELPKGRVIAAVKEHVTAIIDGVIEDTIDTVGEPVHGYWILNPTKLFNVVQGEKRLNSNPLNYSQALKMRSLFELNYGGKVFVL